jgi:hypothetical protein
MTDYRRLSENNGTKQVENEQIERLILEIQQLRRIVESFAGVFLNSKFRYGKASDRWARR